MATIPSPWFNDLPPSYQTEDAKSIKIPSEAYHSAEMILANGAAGTRLKELERDKEELLDRYRRLNEEVNEMNVRAWSRKKHSKHQGEIQSCFRAVRKGREDLKKLNQKINHIGAVATYLTHRMKELSSTPAESEKPTSTPSKELPLKRRFLDDEDYKD